MSKLRVGVVQVKVLKSKEENIKKAKLMINEAANKGCQLIIISSMFTCQYNPTNYIQNAEYDKGQTWHILSEIARMNEIYLVGGSIPEKDDEGHVYNTTYIFNPEGEEIGKYRKIFLSDMNITGGQYFKESKAITGGDKAVVFDTPYGRIGIASGHDIRHPDLFLKLVNMGAKILVILASFNTTTGLDHSEILIRTRALDSQCFVFGVAQARNYEAYYISYAKSLVADPWGRVVNKMGIDEAILIEDIDTSFVDAIRQELPLTRNKEIG